MLRNCLSIRGAPAMVAPNVGKGQSCWILRLTHQGDVPGIKVSRSELNMVSLCHLLVHFESPVCHKS